MIARIWRGRTPAAKAEAYVGYLWETGLKAYGETRGNLGLRLLRRTEGEATEFLVVSFWDSMEAIRGFAGDDPETAVYYPEDDRFLLEREPMVAHYEVVAAEDR